MHLCNQRKVDCDLQRISNDCICVAFGMLCKIMLIYPPYTMRFSEYDYRMPLHFHFVSIVLFFVRRFVYSLYSFECWYLEDFFLSIQP